MLYMLYMQMKQMAEQQKTVAKLVRVSDETYRKLQKAQRVRESYGDVVDRAVDALLEKEGR
jgi:predicted CopG family antitoxin